MHCIPQAQTAFDAFGASVKTMLAVNLDLKTTGWLALNEFSAKSKSKSTRRSLLTGFFSGPLAHFKRNSTNRMGAPTPFSPSPPQKDWRTLGVLTPVRLHTPEGRSPQCYIF